MDRFRCAHEKATIMQTQEKVHLGVLEAFSVSKMLKTKTDGQQPSVANQKGCLEQLESTCPHLDKLLLGFEFKSLFYN